MENDKKKISADVRSISWRRIPTETCLQIIRDFNDGVEPSTKETLAPIAVRLGFRVNLVPTALIETAYTAFNEHEIFIPADVVEISNAEVILSPFHAERVFVMLCHELAEIILRRPLAEPFTYPVGIRDEQHIVATFVHRRMQKFVRR